MEEWCFQNESTPSRGAFVLEAPPGIGPGMKVLQTSALPLGYGAGEMIQGVRTDGTKRKPEPTRAQNPRVEGRRGNFCSAGTTRLEYRRERRYSGFDPRAVRKRAGRIHGILPALFWSGLRGSNPPPRPWQGRALPNELNPRSDHRSLVPPVGIEPTTRGFSVLCSTN